MYTLENNNQPIKITVGSLLYFSLTELNKTLIIMNDTQLNLIIMCTTMVLISLLAGFVNPI
jgi:hypothetical protein